MRQKEEVDEYNIQDDLERLRQKEKTEHEQRREEKKERLEVYLKELKERAEERDKEKMRFEEDFKALLKKKPLYKEIEDRYKKEFIVPALEQKKKKLKELRDFYRPVPIEKILEHEKKYIHSLGDQSKKKEHSTSSKWIYQKPDFESKHYRSFAEEVIKIRRRKDDDHAEKIQRKEKVMELLQEVKENFLPKADHSKTLELQAIVEKLKEKEARQHHRSKTYDEEEEAGIKPRRKIGLEYLKSVKDLVQKKREAGKLKEKDHAVDIHLLSQDKKQTSTSMKSDTVTVKRPNYLTELRNNKKLRSSDNHVELIIKNNKMESSKRKELLNNEIGKLEEKARKKEEIRKYKKKGPNDVDEADEVDNIYINAIKAKLEVLGS
jgi:hypothetical protein